MSIVVAGVVSEVGVGTVNGIRVCLVSIVGVQVRLVSIVVVGVVNEVGVGIVSGIGVRLVSIVVVGVIRRK